MNTNSSDFQKSLMGPQKSFKKNLNEESQLAIEPANNTNKADIRSQEDQNKENVMITALEEM